MKRLIFVAALLCSLPLQAQRGEYNFDSDWHYTFESTSHVATLPRAFNEDYAYRVAIDQLPDDTVRYTKTFRRSRKAKGKKVFIEFEGARQSATVWLNGHRVGMSENGVMAFGFDLTPYINYRGNNRLEVLTDNDWNYHEQQHPDHSPYQWNNKNFNANYGGLPKHVRLHITDRLYQTLPLYSNLGTTGVYIYAKDIDVPSRSAEIVACSEVKNESSKPREVVYEVEVIDNDGHSLGTFRSAAQHIAPGTTATLSASKLFGGLHFWSWGYGYLYTVKTRLIVSGKCIDEVTTRTGFRKTEFADGLFRLNDRVLMVHGYAQRTSNEWPGVGMSVPAWLSDYSNLEMVKSGGNLVRWMHVTPWKQDIESCDRVGLIQAMPAGDAEKDVEGRRWEHRTELMRDAIIYNRNNPSIIFYECGNENISDTHMTEMKAIRDLYDPHGGRAIGSREMLGSKVSEYGGEMLYINKSGRQPLWAMEYCRDEGLRRYWDNWSYPYHRSGDGPLYRNADASAYNHNQDQLAVEHIRRWFDYWEVRPGMGKRVSSGGVKIIFSDTNTHFRGESNYRTSGVSDAMRLPKDSYYAHQVMWNGWVDPETPQTYIMGHWNYPEGTVKPIYVVSNAPRVELLLNGQSVGTAHREYEFLYTFDSVAYRPGTLQAISYDEQGQQVSEYTLTTVGDAATLSLSLMTSPDGMRADGADLALITFEVLDSEGRRCPLDNRNVTFTLEGPAQWRGGLAKGDGNCVLSTTLPVECGVNRVLVRSLTEAGTIRLTAQAEGLAPQTIEWTSRPVAVVHGLSTEHQRDVLPSYLGRGETPTTPSYTDHKETLTIARVIDSQGTTAPTKHPSTDDNEETEWRNDGTSRTSWITYELAAPTRLDEVSLKLTGWRRRSYPLEIFADTTLVWEGSTPMTLGYVHLPVKSALCKRVTIRLKGTATESDAFGQITELTAPVANELDLYKAKDGDKVRSELRIVEIDLLKWKSRDTDDFVKGADVGFLTGQEKRGVVFHDRNGKERECLELLKNDYQMGAIRMRVWVDPRGGTNDKHELLAMAKRAKALGMDLMVDFHYSDSWADPAKQPIPKAWLGHSYEEMKQDLRAHTIDVLTLLKDNGITPRWVQVGNETTNGMLWSVKTNERGWEVKDSLGRTTITHSMGHIKTQPEQYAGFIRTGYDAVKEIFPEAIVIVHLDRGHRQSLYDWHLDTLLKHGGKFDMIGMSLYPYWAMEGKSDVKADDIITDCIANIRHVSEKYGCDVMIVETGYEVDERHPEVMEEGRRQLTRAIHEARTQTNGRCRGIFYWEPQCLPGGYKLGAFNSNAAPTAIMEAFVE